MSDIQRPEAPAEETPLPGGIEFNLGDFTRTVGLMKSLRLMLNNQMVVNVEDLASSVNDAGRKFKLGEIEAANIDVARSYAAFSQRTNQWESQARNLEQQMKMQAERSEARRTLVGSGDRSERIRTYNFPQNRLTDHRCNLTLYKLDRIIHGEMAELITALLAFDRDERLKAADNQL